MSATAQPCTLLHITAPHFVAGAEATGELVTRAAPIIAYMTGWTVFKAMSYAVSRRWVVLWIKT